MYGGWLYRLNYEEYQKREEEIDAKIRVLSEMDEDEELEPLDEAYIIKLDTIGVDDDCIEEKGFFLLLVGNHHYPYEYVEEVIFGLHDSYFRYNELKQKGIQNCDSSELEEWFKLTAEFSMYENEDFGEVLYEILDGESDCGEVIKQIF